MTKRFLSIVLALCMCLGISSTAFAAESNEAMSELTEEIGEVMPENTTTSNGIVPYAGSETWGRAPEFNPKIVGSFPLKGSNRTPIKTMGITGELELYLEFDVGNGKPVKVVMQIQDAGTLKVLKQWATPVCYMHEGYMASSGYHVTKGQKIMINFLLYDENGKYLSNRSVNVTYGYSLY